MTVAARLSDNKMSLRRPKSPGWAAFDLQHKQKNKIIEPQPDNEPYPLLSSTVAPLERCKNIPEHNDFFKKSFSSALLPSVNYPELHGNSSSNKSSSSSSSSRHFGNKDPEESKPQSIFTQLKRRYSWADDGLIEDVLAAVGTDLEKASSSLEAMVTVLSEEEFEDAYLAGLNCGLEDFARIDKTLSADRHETEERASGPSDFVSALEASVNNLSMKDRELHEDTKSILGCLTYAPVEPEWEEDDVYMSHRKDAIKLMRAASRHARAASNSFLIGDHHSARQFSLKAREDWAGAEKLNAKAASEILRIRNEKNSIWKLDLHGLHAAEAVEAVHDQLVMIETRPKNSMACRSDVKMKEEAILTLAGDFCASAEKLDEYTVSRPRQPLLEVITGRGNHSRGAAAIPSAVKSFLAEKGYGFDETRPGAIMVRPKFRRG